MLEIKHLRTLGKLVWVTKNISSRDWRPRSSPTFRRNLLPVISGTNKEGASKKTMKAQTISWTRSVFRLLLVGFLLGILSDPEDGSGVSPRSVSKLPSDSGDSTRHTWRCVNPKSNMVCVTIVMTDKNTYFWLRRIIWHRLCSVIRYETMNLYMHYMNTNAKETRKITKEIFENISGLDPWKLRFEIPTAMVMKNCVFWDITPHSQLKVNGRFGGRCPLHLEGRRTSKARKQLLSLWFLAWLILRPWRCRLHVPPKHRLTSAGLYFAVSQKLELFLRFCNYSEVWG
jgi:hypothetical protein